MRSQENRHIILEKYTPTSMSFKMHHLRWKYRPSFQHSTFIYMYSDSDTADAQSILLLERITSDDDVTGQTSPVVN